MICRHSELVTKVLNMAKCNFEHFYMSPVGKVLRAGYGSSAQPALSLSGGSHNKQLKSWPKKVNSL